MSINGLTLNFSPDKNLTRYLQMIRKFPILEPEEEYVLSKRYNETKDKDAAYRLVTSHLRLVAKIADGFKGYGLPMNEIISEGNVGLVQAVNKFEPEKGFRLSTYAIWWIRAAIQKYILHSWSLVKIGTTAAQKKLFFNLKSIKNKLNIYDDNELTPDESQKIASKLEVPEYEVINMNRRLQSQDNSLNAPISMGDSSNGEWQDWVEETKANQEETLGKSEDLSKKKRLLMKAFVNLNDREKHIIYERRLKNKSTTLDVLSKHYEISRERVRQIELNAVKKLKNDINKEISIKSMKF